MNSTFIASGWPPLRVPLFMMATRGRMACTSTCEFELGCPWCDITGIALCVALQMDAVECNELQEMPVAEAQLEFFYRRILHPSDGARTSDVRDCTRRRISYESETNRSICVHCTTLRS